MTDPVLWRRSRTFPRIPWPAADDQHEQELRAPLRRALVDGAHPDERAATVVAVLSAIGVPHKVLDGGPLSGKALKKRAEEIAAGGWATEAVRKALQATHAAMAAAAASVGAVAAGS